MRASSEEEERPSRLTNTRLVYFCTVICMWRYRAFWYNEGANNGKTFRRTGDLESAQNVQQLKYQSEKSGLNFGAVLCQIGEPGRLSRYSDTLRAGRSVGRTPVRSGFSASVQTGSEAHPASIRWILGPSRSKAPGEWRWPPTPSSAEVKERVELYFYSQSGTSWSVLGRTLPLLYLLCQVTSQSSCDFLKYAWKQTVWSLRY